MKNAFTQSGSSPPMLALVTESRTECPSNESPSTVSAPASPATHASPVFHVVPALTLHDERSVDDGITSTPEYLRMKALILGTLDALLAEKTKAQRAEHREALDRARRERARERAYESRKTRGAALLPVLANTNERSARERAARTLDELERRLDDLRGYLPDTHSDVLEASAKVRAVRDAIRGIGLTD